MSGLPLILGEAPSKSGDRFHDFPLSGAPAKRICDLMGWEVPVEEAHYWTLTSHFETLNVVERFADATPWDKGLAQRRVETYFMQRAAAGQRPKVIVCLGRNAASALSVPHRRKWGEWEDRALYSVVVAPHTSGRSRLWNHPDTERLMKAILTEAEERAKVYA